MKIPTAPASTRQASPEKVRHLFRAQCDFPNVHSDLGPQDLQARILPTAFGANLRLAFCHIAFVSLQITEQRVGLNCGGGKPARYYAVRFRTDMSAYDRAIMSVTTKQ